MDSKLVETDYHYIIVTMDSDIWKVIWSSHWKDWMILAEVDVQGYTLNNLMTKINNLPT